MMKNNATFYMLQTDQLVTKIDGLLTLYVLSSNMKIFSSYTSIQGEGVLMGNSATSKVIGEGTIQFRSHDGCITILQGVRHIPESRYNLISLGILHEKDSISVLKVILRKFLKMPT